MKRAEPDPRLITLFERHYAEVLAYCVRRIGRTDQFCKRRYKMNETLAISIGCPSIKIPTQDRLLERIRLNISQMF